MNHIEVPMLRHAISTFATVALFTAFTLLFPASLLAANKEAKGVPKIVCSSPGDSKGFRRKASRTILRVKTAANVRWGPGESFDKIFDSPLPKYFPLEALCKYEAAFPGGKKETWYFSRDFEGSMGWVSGRVVEEGGALIVKVKQALARSGPGPDKPAIWNLPKNYALKVINKKGKWYHVEDADGENAWIHQSVVWGSSD
ncbi:MAG: SH3 domain-containing protein [Nitrospinae bacterium]|nr:SH3 domain-containing protein [Nitrospinota bacterium]